MKKIYKILFIIIITTILFSCKRDYNKEILMIIDQGTIHDNAFTQGIYEGLKKFSEEKGKSFGYLEATDKTDTGYLALVELAEKKKCQTIIFSGNLFESVVYDAQEAYPNMNFIILDAAPKKDNEVKINSNTISITFEESYGGYLAGYACVFEGFRKMGFLGGMDIESVRKFGYGYINGIIKATQDLKITEEVQIFYDYNGSFMPSDSVFTKASAWYQSKNVDVIFSCSGRAISSVIASSEIYNKKVIGVDINQMPLSETVINSVIKDLEKAVFYTLNDLYYNNKGNFSKSIYLEKSTKLVEDFTRFSNFDSVKYDYLKENYDNKNLYIIDFNTKFNDIKEAINSSAEINVKIN